MHANLPEKEEDGRQQEVLVGTRLAQQLDFLLQDARALRLALACDQSDTMSRPASAHHTGRATSALQHHSWPRRGDTLSLCA